MMTGRKRWYLITYDVRDEKRLRRVAQLLEGYGNRLQYSVFRCHLSERSAERLRYELEKLLSNEDDMLLIGLCDTCAEGVRQHGSRKDWTADEVAYEII